MILTLKDVQKLKRSYIIESLKMICPNVELSVGKWSTDLVYYTANVSKGKIEVSRNTRSIYLSSEPEKLAIYFFRSKKEAIEAIEKVMPRAKEKFEKCLKAYYEITSKLGFDIGHNYDGDMYGIYNEYEYISFNMDNFNFSFEINQ